MRTKSVWRKHLMARRNEITMKSHVHDSEKVSGHLCNLIDKEVNFPIHLYLAMGMEIDLADFIHHLLVQNLMVVSSKSLPDQQLENFVFDPKLPMSEGMYGTQFQADAVIYEGPYSYMIIPGLAFDHKGVRLGYGAGYYDRFLARYPQAVKIGVAYDFQYVDSLPREEHDVCMDVIVTPSQIIKVYDRPEFQ